MICRRFYTLLFYCLLPVILLRLLYRSIKAPPYRDRWAERFGICQSAIDQPTLWLHAVSVGEILAAVPLIKVLQKQQPDKLLVITTTTPTGSERVRIIFAQEIADKKILHIYAPYDIPFALDRFLKKIKPQLVIVMETELWPNMIHSCFVRNIPIIVANARLSEKSAKGYARISCLTKNMFAEITLIAAQNQQDGLRFVDLGLHKEKLCVTGSIKFDLDLSPDVLRLAEQLRNNWSNRGSNKNARLIMLAASTHLGEDEIIINAFKEWKKFSAHLLLVLVPRHPERFNSVYQLCKQQGFNTQRRSELLLSNAAIDANTDILLGDTMGELLAFYGACDIAFVGGSLVPVGGHNLIEPAAWALPVVSGKYLSNFMEVKELLLRENALIICETEKDLLSQVKLLLLDESRRITMGKSAQKIAVENRGALHKFFTEINKFIK